MNEFFMDPEIFKPPKPITFDGNAENVCCCEKIRPSIENLDASHRNPIMEECPLIYEELKKMFKEAAEKPESLIGAMFLMMYMGTIYDEQGRAGLRELEQKYKERLQK